MPVDLSLSNQENTPFLRFHHDVRNRRMRVGALEMTMKPWEDALLIAMGDDDEAMAFFFLLHV